MSKGKLRLIALGGAGISIVGNLTPRLKELGTDGFAEIEPIFFDASEANAKRHPGVAEFHRVQSIYQTKQVDGGGGARVENIDHIRPAVKAFTDAIGVNPNETSVFYVLVFGMAGATGSTAGPLFTQILQESGLPFYVIAIGDSLTKASSENTIKTLAGLDAATKRAGKPLTISYHDNFTAADVVEQSEREETVDKRVYRDLVAFSMLASGDNYNIDQKDVATLITTPPPLVALPAGLYQFMIFGGSNVDLGKVYKPMVGRTITVDDVSPDFNASLHHHKHGYVSEENVFKAFDATKFPIHYVTISNYFTSISDTLNRRVKEFEDALAKVKTDDITANGSSTDDDLIL